MRTKTGKRSAAALSIPAISALEVIERPNCPHDLNDEESEVWFSVVNRLPADWFPSETHPLLTQYCRAVVQARRVAELMEKATSDLDEDGNPTLTIGAYNKLLLMQARQNSTIAMLATKMRISQQSTTNHRGNKKQVTARKPWED
jgi:hypothetical protein